MAGESGFGIWLGQAGVIAVGWYVVHKLTDRRDREKSRREALVKIADTLSEDVDDILTCAREYHSSAQRNIASELKLKMQLQDLGIRVNGLSDIYSDQALIAHSRSKLGALRRAVTGSHFEDEHTGALPDNAAQHLLMVEAALDLKRALVTIKNRQLKA